MSRQILRPLKVWTDANGQPVRGLWRDVTYRGKVLLVWKLRDKWWDADRFSNRTYYRMERADHQVFDLYQDAAKDGLWVLSHIQD